MKKTIQVKWINLVSVVMLLFSFLSMVTYINIDKISDERREKECKMQIDSLTSEILRVDSIMMSYDLRLRHIHELNWDNIDFWLTFFDIRNPEIVKRQIYLETANLTSPICLNNKNLFGMKFPGGRETTAIGVNRGHAVYANYIASIFDYSIWQKRKYKDVNEDYFNFLERVGYAEDKKYINILKSIPDSVFY